MSYQTSESCILGKCLKTYIKPRGPSEHGWLIKDEVLDIRWHSIPDLPDSFFKQVSCSCKKTSCATNRCSCKSRNFTCSELCKCSEGSENRNAEVTDMVKEINMDEEIDINEDFDLYFSGSDDESTEEI